MAAEPSAQDRALTLLRERHEFPGPFLFRVVILPRARAAVLDAVDAVLGSAESVTDVGERASRHGTYLALHVSTSVERADTVLEVYAALRAVDGVRTVM